MDFIRFKNDWGLRWVIFLLFVVLLIGAFYFYQERMLFSDASFIFCEVVNKNMIQLSGVQRYGAFITQMFPAICSLAHIPLKESLIIYSLSFNLFYLTVVSLLLFKFKNTKLALLFAFYFTLIVSDTYFWTNNEVHQAMGWLFLLFAIIHHYKINRTRPVLHFAVVIVLAFLSLFTHPLMLFVFPFLWLFTILEKNLNPYNNKQIIGLSIVFGLIVAVKFYTMNQGSYDTEKIRGATHFSVLDIIHAFSSPLAKIMYGLFVKDYFFIPLLFLLGMISAIQQKRYKQIALVLAFSVGYFLAVCMTYTNFTTFYTESEWMSFTVITCALFVYYFAPNIKASWLLSAIVLIFAVRINFIALSSTKFTERKDWIFSMVTEMEKEGINKGYVYSTPEIEQKLLMNWGVPVESMLASALKKDMPLKTFVVDTKEGIERRIPPTNNSMISCFSSWKIQEINHFYFSVDTISDYKLISINPALKN